ncbi:hypothetical protein ACFY12_06225 [Streptomyces sp. NPDC001339]|uniref:hypothetical protein n=1 Tax=Streptomyces sp. NPDC001339 TaxID=3364563 RepID=UPI0036C1F547
MDLQPVTPGHVLVIPQARSGAGGSSRGRRRPDLEGGVPARTGTAPIRSVVR